MNLLIFIGAVVCSLIILGGALYFYVALSSNKRNLPIFKFLSHKDEQYNTINSIDTSTTKILQSLCDVKVSIRQIQSNKEYRTLVDELKEIKTVVNELSYDISQRFETIEYYLNEIKNSKTVDNSKIEMNSSTTEFQGYFGFPISQKYFKFYRDSTDDTFFKAYIDKDRGSFDLISLEIIKSEEGLDNVVKFVGSVRKSDAKSYKVLETGFVSKVDDKGMWKIEKPLVVELF